MANYKAPLRDIDFILNQLLDFPGHYSDLNGCVTPDKELMMSIVAEGAKFAEQELSPINASGDREGCHWSPEGVQAPAGFKEAYQKFVEAGWPTLAADEKYGGQGLPESRNLVVSEMLSSANVSWSGYSGLTQGAVKTLTAYGSEWVLQHLLPNMVAGHWTGTMCLTEAHCGSDLGLIRTRAVRGEDGSYQISGNKIFISNGDHDVADNIIHIVLGRIEGAPKGTKGLSLFVVPKFHVDSSGLTDELNGVTCVGIEEKMGIHGFATCAMSFEGARGYLLGAPNEGLACMFTFMNAARLHAGLQGVVHSERAYQGAVSYAHERLAMRALSGPKYPEAEADPIIVHPDVRRMLFTIKAFAEGTRAFAYYLAQLTDLVSHGTEEQRQRAEGLLALLTPVFKGFVSEVGVEAASLGVQIYGGHGYIREWGMEQNLRDSRIATLYEGTTGIQALDLLGRKILGSGGKLMQSFVQEVLAFCEQAGQCGEIHGLCQSLRDEVQSWVAITGSLGQAAMKDPEEVGAASVDYLMYSGYLVLGYFWVRIAKVSQDQIEQGDEDNFYNGKLHTARFYFERILPRTASLKSTMTSGAGNLMAMDAECFSMR